MLKLMRLVLLLLTTASALNVQVLPATKKSAAAAPTSQPWLHQFGLAPRSWSVREGERYSSQDWLSNVLSIPRSLTLKRIKSHLLANLAVTAVVLALRAKGVQLTMPALPHQLTGSFLGLLLVFRTNVAYARESPAA